MFSRCSSLSSLPDISKWDVNKFINVYQIFYQNENLILSKGILKKFQDKNDSDGLKRKKIIFILY